MVFDKKLDKKISKNPLMDVADLGNSVFKAIGKEGEMFKENVTKKRRLL